MEEKRFARAMNVMELTESVNPRSAPQEFIGQSVDDQFLGLRFLSLLATQGGNPDLNILTAKTFGYNGI